MTHAFRVDDRAPAGPAATATRSPSPSAPRPTASRRCSAPTTTRASRGAPASRRPTPGPSSPGSPARPIGYRAGRAGLAGHVPPRRHVRQDRHDRRRDERRPVEVGVGAGWNDLEHRQLGLPFPPIDERMDAARGPARGPARPVGRAGRLVLRRARPSTIRGRPLLPEAGRGARPPDRAERRRRGRGSSSAGPASPRGARLTARWCDEFNTLSRRPGDGRGDLREARRRVRGDRPRSRRRSSRSAMAGVLVGRTDDEVRGARARRCSRRSATTPAATTGSRSAATAGSSGPPTRPARWSAASPTPASSGSCSRTSSRGTSTTST